MMDRIRKIEAQYGIEGLVGITFAVVALGIAVYEFVGGNTISTPVLVALLAILLIEVFVQRSKLDRNRDEIVSSLKGVKVEVIADNDEFLQKRYRLLTRTKNSMLDTELCLPKGGKLPYRPDKDSVYR